MTPNDFTLWSFDADCRATGSDTITKLNLPPVQNDHVASIFNDFVAQKQDDTDIFQISDNNIGSYDCVLPSHTGDLRRYVSYEVDLNGAYYSLHRWHIEVCRNMFGIMPDVLLRETHKIERTLEMMSSKWNWVYLRAW